MISASSCGAAGSTAPFRWPQALAAPRAAALGFIADNGIDEVVQAFVEDDLATQKGLA